MVETQFSADSGPYDLLEMNPKLTSSQPYREHYLLYTNNEPCGGI